MCFVYTQYTDILLFQSCLNIYKHKYKCMNDYHIDGFIVKSIRRRTTLQCDQSVFSVHPDYGHKFIDWFNLDGGDRYFFFNLCKKIESWNKNKKLSIQTKSFKLFNDNNLFLLFTSLYIIDVGEARLSAMFIAANSWDGQQWFETFSFFPHFSRPWPVLPLAIELADPPVKYAEQYPVLYGKNQKWSIGNSCLWKRCTCSLLIVSVTATATVIELS